MFPEINSEVTHGNIHLERVLKALRLRTQMGFGVGNTYYVVKSSETFFSQIYDKYYQKYDDGSVSVHADAGDGLGIQSALDACVANRNDYVLVYPSEVDYDLTVALTLSKKAVHLLCLAGMGYTVGAPNAVRIHQTGAFPIMEVSAHAIEIAGFYLKNYATKGGVIISNTTYGSQIHNNYWAMNLSGATNEPMLGPLIANTSGDAGAWGTWERNFFQSQGGANATIAAIMRTNSQATGTRMCLNEIQIGDTNNIATRGIQNLSVKGITNDNKLMAAQTGSGVGVFTKGIQIHVSGSAIDNRGALAAGDLLVGGTDEVSFVNNRDGAAGGATPVEA